MAEARSNIFAGLSYRDAAAAIEWLERAFGFERVLVIPGPDGTIAHSELRYGDGVVMVGTAHAERGWLSPLDVPAVSQSLYVVVEDPDAHFERAKAAGAEIMGGLENTDYGSRGYSAKDMEGHHWHFGTYRPGASA